jgi:ribosomal protein S18 acetylase RimI-like enzyme
MLIRPATKEDVAAIWSIIGPTIRAGETYALQRDMSEAEALSYWMGPDRETFVAEDDGRIVGTYYLHANQAGGGDHVANCGYMTDSAFGGRGIARRMCEHSLAHARARGFRAMQFNFVVSTNERAVRLWTALGFKIVGRLPRAFRHPSLGEVDALVMFRML